MKSSKILGNSINQKTLFVESLYNTLRKEAKKAEVEYNKYASTASEYLSSGLSESEAAELLIVDGLDREAALGYVAMAKDAGDSPIDAENEYSFVFEDSFGNVFSSYDIDKTITASSSSEAWQKAGELVGDDREFEIKNILSVDKIS